MCSRNNAAHLTGCGAGSRASTTRRLKMDYFIQNLSTANRNGCTILSGECLMLQDPKVKIAFLPSPPHTHREFRVLSNTFRAQRAEASTSLHPSDACAPCSSLRGLRSSFGPLESTCYGWLSPCVWETPPRHFLPNPTVLGSAWAEGCERTCLQGSCFCVPAALGDLLWNRPWDCARGVLYRYLC